MESPIFSIKGNGKLLLTSEYFVLDGAEALAVPARFGQFLEIYNQTGKNLHWESVDHLGKVWFSAEFSLPQLKIHSFSDEKTAKTLQVILLAIRELSPFFLKETKGLLARTRLEFPNDWGLGSSSTLLHALSSWAGVDVYELSAATFGGSGYDLACAGADSPILYTIENSKPKVESIEYKPLFTNNLFFIHLGKKQNSRQGIKHYREKVLSKTKLVDEFTELTKRFRLANDLAELNDIIEEHERKIEENLELKRAKNLYFNDFDGEIKSLGAWGGDFVLASSLQTAEEVEKYFKKRNFTTILPFHKMVK